MKRHTKTRVAYPKLRSIPMQMRSPEIEMQVLESEKIRCRQELERLSERKDFLEEKIRQITKDMENVAMVWEENLQNKITMHQLQANRKKQQWGTTRMQY